MMEFFIVIKEEAEADLIEIFEYYEIQRQGLGIRFLDSFEKSLQKIEK